MSLRIAYLTTRYPSVSHTFILREVEELRSREMDIRTYAIWRANQEDLLSPANRKAFASTYALIPPRVQDYARAHTRALFTSPRQYFRTFRDSLRYGTPGLRGRFLPLLWAIEAIALWHHCRRHEIEHVHTHFAGGPPVVAGLSAGFGRRSRAIGGPRSWSATVHGSAEFFDRRLAVKLEDAAFVACISDFARSQVMAVLDRDHWDRLLVVHCGLDVRAPEAHPEVVASPSAEGAVGPSRQGLHLLVVGRLVPVKGHGVLLQAMSDLVKRGLDVHLTVVGDGPMSQTLTEMAERLGISGRVEWRGAVGQHETPAYFAAADIFCLPSFQEGVPIVLMEAMLAARPVIATGIAGVPELLEEGVTGLLVTPGRADSLAQAIDALAQDPALRTRMGEAGRRKVEAEFDIRHSAQQLAEAFDRYVDG